MSKKGIVPIIGIVLLVAGFLIALLLNYAMTNIISIISAFIGAWLIMVYILKRKRHRIWGDYMFFSVITVGSVIFVFGGFDRETIISISGALVVLLGVLLYSIVSYKIHKNKKKDIHELENI